MMINADMCTSSDTIHTQFNDKQRRARRSDKPRAFYETVVGDLWISSGLEVSSRGIPGREFEYLSLTASSWCAFSLRLRFCSTNIQYIQHFWKILNNNSKTIKNVCCLVVKLSIALHSLQSKHKPIVVNIYILLSILQQSKLVFTVWFYNNELMGSVITPTYCLNCFSKRLLETTKIHKDGHCHFLPWYGNVAEISRVQALPSSFEFRSRDQLSIRIFHSFFIASKN